ncbi:MAG: tetraacyldisaccharide 4'-kinase [Cycloclasticus sp. symbiont of Bathymodiolus heckerae]|nr:MAG: tetraacyldisaccharide 4'-kinase [Cycloclasticus sp. symbiont of Bathymodiolus heckerae]
MSHKTSRFFDSMWYGQRPVALLFVPLSWLFSLVTKLRYFLYKKGWLKSTRLSVPVVIVGNITVGGTGKTPVVIWVAELLKSAGYSPGVISRGYGGIASSWPQQVREDSDSRVVGDEAKILARRTACPVAVGPNRAESAQALIDHHQCDIIISDDGLQHYALQRDIEIALVDGERRYGNRYLLPAGPLREPEKRLKTVDFVICNGLANTDEYPLKVEGGEAVNLLDETNRLPLESFNGKSCHAIAGLGNPSRFFSHLKKYKLSFESHIFPDHFKYTEKDINFDDDKSILMTEKDAVKCTVIANEKHWYVPIRAQLTQKFGLTLLSLIKEKTNG